MGFCNTSEHLQDSAFTEVCKLCGCFLNYILVLHKENCRNNDRQTNVYYNYALKNKKVNFSMLPAFELTPHQSLQVC